VSDQWVSIGRLFRVRGNRGELAGELDSRQPDREKSLEEVALEANGRRAVFRVEEVWRHQGRPVFKFEGIDSISDAEAWERAEILVRSEDLAPLGEGEYSYADLVGSRVVRTNGEPLGVVKAVEEYGGPLLLNVETPDGREIRVELPEGLEDL
jgi:16S rRNA processing protein RimM